MTTASRNLDAIAGNLIGTPAIREVISPDPESSVRWRVHGYPDPLARWNFHPEYEVHLIRRGTGRYIIGDAVHSFGPGHLALVGSNLPHDWISDLGEVDYIAERDVVLQFDEHWLQRCQRVLPELQELDGLLARAAHGIEFLGTTAERGAERMELIGSSRGAERLQHLFALLHLLNSAPQEDYRLLVNDWISQIDELHDSRVISQAIEYIFANISSEVRLATAARIVGMSDSAFSRYFKAASGQTFSELVKKLRLTQACRLLEKNDKQISTIATEVGYSNLSNFNRQFLSSYGMTPRQYRKSHRL